jgi:hypothetical protein
LEPAQVLGSVLARARVRAQVPDQGSVMVPAQVLGSGQVSAKEPEWVQVPVPGLAEGQTDLAALVPGQESDQAPGPGLVGGRRGLAAVGWEPVDRVSVLGPVLALVVGRVQEPGSVQELVPA